MLRPSFSLNRLAAGFLTFLILLGIFVGVNGPRHAHLLDSLPFADGYTQSPSQHAGTPSQLSKFWAYFGHTLREATPRCALPHKQISAYFSAFREGDGKRPDLISMHAEDIQELSTAHSWFVKQISRPDYPVPPYIRGSSGIVTTAGGHFLPEAIVSIKMLRRTGSKLPVDVFFQDDDEIEQEICDTILKKLNAQCHVLSRILDADGAFPRRQNITHYQLKAFALLFSRFDNVLWLDADEVALVDPAKLFESDPYKSRGLVLWPDYWAPTSSTLFYQIAGVVTPDVELRAASETGQIMINKSKHLRTLMLAAYYNYFGPSHYYRLLSQGAIGEGDKETFLAAAQALNVEFWAVSKEIDTLGFIQKDGNYRGIAMLQADPRADFQRAKSGASDTKIPPAFLHDEGIKPNAARFIPVWKEQAEKRIFGSKENTIATFGYDIERAIFDEMVFVACGLNGYVFKDWVNKGEVCRLIIEAQDQLFKEEE